MEYIKIGEIFKHKGDWYQCVKNPTFSCKHCDFYDNKHDLCNISRQNYLCSERSDKKTVIFKKLEKVGEPFFVNIQGNNVLKQRYKLYEPKVTLENYWYRIDGNFISIEIKQKENMEEKKLNLKPFNLEAAKAGKPICTRDGRMARIVCFDRKFLYEGQDYCIVALINEGCYNEAVYSYTNDGLFTPGKINKSDLMMLPEKKEGWVNIVRGNDGKSYMGRGIFQSKEEAENTIKAFSDNLIDTVKINWEE